MNIGWKVSFVTIFVLVAPLAAHCSGSFLTGTNLQSECLVTKAEITYFQANASCLSYIEGVADSTACDNGGVVAGYSWKPEQNITAGQLQKVVVNWLNNHPEKLHLAAQSLVAYALAEAFPCN